MNLHEIQRLPEQEITEVIWTSPEQNLWYAVTNLGLKGPQFCFLQHFTPNFYAISAGYGSLRGYIYSDGTGKNYTDKARLNNFKYGILQMPINSRINPNMIVRKHNFFDHMTDFGKAGGANWQEIHQTELRVGFINTFVKDMESLHNIRLTNTVRNMEIMLETLELAVNSFPGNLSELLLLETDTGK